MRTASNRTKNYVAEKLLEMNQATPLRKITITSLAKYCEMNRGTIYYHFYDIQDVINYVFHSRVTEPLRERILEECSDYGTLTTMCLELMAKDSHFYREAFALRGQNDLTSYFRDEIKGNWHMIVDMYLEEEHPNAPKGDPRYYYVSDCLASGHIAMTESWIRGGMKESPKEIAQLLELCSRRGLFPSLDHIAVGS